MSQQFSGEIATNPQLETPVISLRCEAEDPSESILAEVAPFYGSNLFTYHVGGHDLIHTNPELLKDRDWTGTLVLWPIPNRVSGKEYEFEGRTYSVQDIRRKHGNETLIHGFVDDKPWQHGEPFANNQEAGVKTWFDITPDSPVYEYYPFHSRLTLTYLLRKAGITVEYEIENRGDTNMPFGFALHPFFTMPTGAERTLVTLPAEYSMEADEELLPTGKLLPMGSEGFDVRQPTPVSELMLDHVFTGLDDQADPTITYPDLNLQMKLASSPDLTHMVLFTSEQRQGFFCYENQSGANNMINLHARAQKQKDEALAKAAHLLIAGPGETRKGFIQYRVEQLTGSK